MFLKIYKLFPKDIWIWTLVSFIFVLRKTIFNVARDVGSTAAVVDRGTSLLVLGICASAFVLMRHTRDFKFVRRNTSSFVNYYIFCVISILWAGNFISVFFKAAEVIMSFLICAFVIHKIQNLKLAVYYTIIASTAITYCDFGNHLIQAGFTADHTNGYSVSAMIAILLALASVKYDVLNFKDVVFFIGLDVLALILGTSSASYMATIVGLLCLYGSGKKGKNVIGIGLLAILGYIVYTMFSDKIQELVFYGKSADAIKSGTGRREIWDAAFKSFSDHKLLGSGFFVGERNLYQYGSIMVLSAHNGFLSVLVNTGIVGIVLFGVFFMKWFRIIYKRLGKSKYAAILFPAFVSSTLNIMAFPGIGSDWNYVSPVMFYMIAICFLKLPYEFRRK